MFYVSNDTESTKKVRALFPVDLHTNNYGNEVGITIQSGYNDLSYLELLVLLAKREIKIAITYIQSVKGSVNAIVNPITVCRTNHVEQDGVILSPVIDPGQQQTVVLAVNTPFVLNFLNFNCGLFLTIPPKSTVKYMFYISDIGNDEDVIITNAREEKKIIEK